MAGRSSAGSWRVLLAFLLLAVASAVGLALNVRTQDKTTTLHEQIRARGAPCIAVKLPHGGSFPSEGCERLARLLSETCTLNPSLCKGVARGRDQRVARRDLARAVAKELARQRRVAASRRRRERVAARRRARSPVRTVPLPRPRGQSTTPSGQLAPGSAPPSSPSSPPPPAHHQPTPSEVVNNAGHRVTDTANDVTDSVGAGRPVPSLPPLPIPPGAPPAICPRPPIC